MFNPKPVKKLFSNQVIEFSSKKKQNISEEITKSNNKLYKKEKNSIKKDNDEFLTLKQAKFDVFKYGIKGFSKQEQENANMQLAIKLGAKVSKYKLDLKKN
jgi:hypothetical protein